jgi:hypothetical protein
MESLDIDLKLSTMEVNIIINSLQTTGENAFQLKEKILLEASNQLDKSQNNNSEAVSDENTKEKENN